MTTAIDCSILTNCSCVGYPACPTAMTNWDTLFCICSGAGGCIPAGSGFSHPQAIGGNNQDTTIGLIGQYQTSASTAGTATSTCGGAATWTNPNNAKTQDTNFATIIPDSVVGTPGTAVGSQYIVLTGYGFSIPLTASIVGIAIAMLAKQNGGSNNLAVYGFNVALVLGGTLYYMADPGGNAGAGYVQSAPYSYTQGWTNSGTYTGNTFGPAGQGLIIGGSPAINTTQFLGGAIFEVKGSGNNPNVGDQPSCASPGLDLSSPEEKDFILSPSKTNWAPADINDSSFGVALSVESEGKYSGVQTGPTYSLNCMGVAVYWVPGGAGSPNNPSVWISD